EDEGRLITVEWEIARACGNPRRIRIHLACWPGRVGVRGCPVEIRNSKSYRDNARCTRRSIDPVERCDRRPHHIARLVGNPEHAALREGEPPWVLQVRVEHLRGPLDVRDKV